MDHAEVASATHVDGVQSVHELHNQLGLKPRENLPPLRRKRPYRMKQPKSFVVTKTPGMLEAEREKAGLTTAEQRIANTAALQREEAERRRRRELEQANLEACDRLGLEPHEEGGGRWCFWNGALCIRTNGDHDHPFANTRGITGFTCPTPLGPLVADLGRWRVWTYIGHLPELKRKTETSL